MNAKAAEIVVEKPKPIKPGKKPVKTGKALALVPPKLPAPSHDSRNVMAMIGAASKDKKTDVAKMERLVDLYERIKESEAKAAFSIALVHLKPKLPVIDKKGRILVREKTDSGKRDGEVTQNTPFAKWEDIDEAITPVLYEAGFVLTHRTSDMPDGRIRVTAVLMHVQGHREETSLVLPFDTSGSKNNVQAIGSSTKYGFRYTAVAILNIRTRDQADDDGKASGPPAVVGKPITAEQFDQLVELARAAECPAPRLIQNLNEMRPKKHPLMSLLQDLPAKRYDEAVQMIRSYESNKADREKARAKAQQEKT